MQIWYTHWSPASCACWAALSALERSSFTVYLFQWQWPYPRQPSDGSLVVVDEGIKRDRFPMYFYTYVFGNCKLQHLLAGVTSTRKTKGKKRHPVRHLIKPHIVPTPGKIYPKNTITPPSTQGLSVDNIWRSGQAPKHCPAQKGWCSEFMRHGRINNYSKQGWFGHARQFRLKRTLKQETIAQSGVSISMRSLCACNLNVFMFKVESWSLTVLSFQLKSQLQTTWPYRFKQPYWVLIG